MKRTIATLYKGFATCENWIKFIKSSSLSLVQKVNPFEEFAFFANRFNQAFRDIALHPKRIYIVKN